MKKITVFLLVLVFSVSLFALSVNQQVNSLENQLVSDNSDLTVSSNKEFKHYITFASSPLMLKNVNFFNDNKSYESKYGFGLNLNYRYNLTNYLFAAVNAEYRGFVEQALLPKTYVSEMPLTLQLGYYNRLVSNLELFTSLSGGVNIGIFSPFISLNGLLAQFDLGFNYFLSENIALNVKSNVSASYQKDNKDSQYDTITLIITPIQIGMTIGV